MTTIAYVNGELAADGRMTGNGSIFSERFQKIGDKGGFLFGAAGDAVGVTAFLSWCSMMFDPGTDEADKCECPAADFDGIIVAPDGSYSIFNAGQLVTRDVPTTQPAALGSGGPAALGALHTGCTAEQAVRAALKVDVFSGGKVDVVKISRLSVKKRSK